MNDLDLLLKDDLDAVHQLQKAFEAAMRDYRKSTSNKIYSKNQRRGEFITFLRRKIYDQKFFVEHRQWLSHTTHRAIARDCIYKRYQNVIKYLLDPNSWADVMVLADRSWIPNANSNILRMIMNRVIENLSTEEMETEESLDKLNGLLTTMRIVLEEVKGTRAKLEVEVIDTNTKMANL